MNFTRDLEISPYLIHTDPYFVTILLKRIKILTFFFIYNQFEKKLKYEIGVINAIYYKINVIIINW